MSEGCRTSTGKSSDDEEAHTPKCHVPAHEAGHAVGGHAVGLEVDQVIAKQRGPTSAKVPAAYTAYQRALALASYYAAGSAAEEIILGDATASHGTSDQEEIERLLTDHPEWSSEISAAVDTAQAVVVKYQSVIEELAKRLCENPPTVKGDELTTLLKRMTREPPPLAPE